MKKINTFDWYQMIVKRFLDIIFSGTALILLSPLLLLIYLSIWGTSGEPAIYCQPRPGKDGKVFKMYKFRTMTNTTDEQGNLLPDDERLTPYGKFLRSTSLDELPEFVNIFKGDMSLVGPRPLLVKYLPLYTSEQHKRHLVKPGLTGLAQISGRNLLSWEEKLKLDVHYVKNLSIFHDLKIIGLTVVKMITREGISAHGHSTTEEFKGSKEKK